MSNSSDNRSSMYIYLSSSDESVADSLDNFFNNNEFLNSEIDKPKVTTKSNISHSINTSNIRDDYIEQNASNTIEMISISSDDPSIIDIDMTDTGSSVHTNEYVELAEGYNDNLTEYLSDKTNIADHKDDMTIDYPNDSDVSINEVDNQSSDSSYLELTDSDSDNQNSSESESLDENLFAFELDNHNVNTEQLKESNTENMIDRNNSKSRLDEFKLFTKKERSEAAVINSIITYEFDNNPNRQYIGYSKTFGKMISLGTSTMSDVQNKIYFRRYCCDLLKLCINRGTSHLVESLSLFNQLTCDDSILSVEDNTKSTIFLEPQLFFVLVKQALECGFIPAVEKAGHMIVRYSPFFSWMVDKAIPFLSACYSLKPCRAIIDNANEISSIYTPSLMDDIICHLFCNLDNPKSAELKEIFDNIVKNKWRFDGKWFNHSFDRSQEHYHSNLYPIPICILVPKLVNQLKLSHLHGSFFDLPNNNTSHLSGKELLKESEKDSEQILNQLNVKNALTLKFSTIFNKVESKELIASTAKCQTIDKRRSSRGLISLPSWVHAIVTRIEKMLGENCLETKLNAKISSLKCCPIEQNIAPRECSYKHMLNDIDCPDKWLTSFLIPSSGPIFSVIYDLIEWFGFQRHLRWNDDHIDSFIEILNNISSGYAESMPKIACITLLRLCCTNTNIMSSMIDSRLLSQCMSPLLDELDRIDYDSSDVREQSILKEIHLLFAYYTFEKGLYQRCLEHIVFFDKKDCYGLSCPGGKSICISQIRYNLRRLLTFRAINDTKTCDSSFYQMLISALSFDFSENVLEQIHKITDPSKLITVKCSILKSIEFLSSDMLKYIEFDCKKYSIGFNHAACVLSSLLKFLKMDCADNPVLSSDRFWIWVHNAIESIDFEDNMGKPYTYVPNHILLLDHIHESVGRNLGCCGLNVSESERNEDQKSLNGDFLRYTIKCLCKCMKTCSLESNAFSIMRHIFDQSLYCLYGVVVPDRKTKSITTHINNTPRDISKEDCRLIYTFVKYLSVSNYDLSVQCLLTPNTSQGELIYCKIVKSLGWNVDENAILLCKYIQNLDTTFAYRIIKPNEDNKRKDEALPIFDLSPFETDDLKMFRDIFHLIADYYFKNNNTLLAEQYFLRNLVLNSLHYDSFSLLCCCYCSQLQRVMSRRFDFDSNVILDDGEQWLGDCKLNSLEWSFRNRKFYLLAKDSLNLGNEFNDIYPLYRRMCGSFALATKLINNCDLSIHQEFALLNYTLASNCSKSILRSSFIPIDENIRIELMAFRKYCFLQARERYRYISRFPSEQQQDKWLYYLMLGKIKIKNLDNENCLKILTDALVYFMTSLTDLIDKDAVTSSNISYQNPSNLSKEFCQVLYLMASACLKCIINYKLISIPLSCLHILREAIYVKSKFITGIEKFYNVENFVNNLLPSSNAVENLIRYCLIILLSICVRFHNHYKSLYRLAWFFLKSHIYLCPELSKFFLLYRKHHRLNQKMSYETKNIRLHLSYLRKFITETFPHGLFSGRTKTSLFSGIWRMNSGNSSSDIERPGSFPSCMYKASSLLIDLLSNDPIELGLICQQLSQVPDPRNHYINESDRIFLCKKAFFISINGYLKKLMSIEENTCTEKQYSQTYESSLLRQIYPLWLLNKNILNVSPEECEAALFIAYRQLTGNASTNISIDAVQRFCSNRETINTGNVKCMDDVNPCKKASRRTKSSNISPISVPTSVTSTSSTTSTNKLIKAVSLTCNYRWPHPTSTNSSSSNNDSILKK